MQCLVLSCPAGCISTVGPVGVTVGAGANSAGPIREGGRNGQRVRDRNPSQLPSPDREVRGGAQQATRLGRGATMASVGLGGLPSASAARTRRLGGSAGGSSGPVRRVRQLLPHPPLRPLPGANCRSHCRSMPLWRRRWGPHGPGQQGAAPPPGALQAPLLPAIAGLCACGCVLCSARQNYTGSENCL